MPAEKLWTPNGLVDITGATAPTERVELRAGLMEWLRQFQDFAHHFDIGLHCAKCQADLVGKNADSDAVASVACGCRVFVGANQHFQPEARH